jgi:hypothetical protein
MRVIIESISALEELLVYRKDRCYLGIISENDNYHPKLVNTVAVYFRPFTANQGYIIPLDHMEGINMGKTKVLTVLNQFLYLYTLSKKEALYHGFIQDYIDVSLLAMLEDSRKLEISTPIPILDLYYRYHKGFREVNKITPLVKLYEKQEHIYNSIKHYLTKDIPEYFKFYNNTAVKILYLIEQEGIKVSRDIIDVYSLNNPEYNISKGRIFTSFNLYNHTTRPSNSFNTINFSAIPKDEQHRKVFIPENDYFVQFDFDSYHLRLLCNLIDYPLTEESGHKQLAKHYFNTEIISDSDYQKAKQLNFEAMYGRIPEEYKHLEFFVKLRSYLTQIWNTYKNQGFIEDPISKRKVGKHGEINNPAKLLNYLIQSIETSRNTLILKELLRHLSNRKTKIVHYIYDAIIIDFNKEDQKQLLEQIETVLSEDKKYPVKFSYNQNLCL